MDKYKRTSFNLILQLSSFLISVVANLIITPMIVNQIGKELYGYVDLANTFTNYITIFTAAFNTMLGRYVAISFHKNNLSSANKYYTSITILNIIFSFILIIPMVILVIFLDYVIVIPELYITDIKILFLLIFISFLINISFSSFDVSTFVKNRMDLNATKSILSTAIKFIIFAILMMMFSPSVWFIGVGIIISTLLCSYFAYICKQKLTSELKVKSDSFSMDAASEIFKIGIWNSISQLNQILLNGLDLLITNQFLGVLHMSILSLSKIVPMQLNGLVSLVSNTFNPQLVKSYSENFEEFISDLKFSIKASGFLCSIPLIGFCVFGEAFYELWLTDMNAGEISTIQICSILSLLSALFSVYIYPLYNTFQLHVS